MSKSVQSKKVKKKPASKKVQKKNNAVAGVITESQVSTIKKDGIVWVEQMRSLINKEEISFRISNKKNVVDEINKLLDNIERLINENKFTEVSQQLTVFNNKFLKYFK